MRWFRWGRARNSWHLYKFTDRGGDAVAYCGRRRDDERIEYADDPGNERTCETCFRNREAAP